MAKLDTPTQSGQTPREMYKVASENGMPTPLDNIPQYDSSFEKMMSIFWDIFQYKTDYDDFMPLSLFESYHNLFDTRIHPLYVSLISKIDRVYTVERNAIINKRD